MGHSLVIPESLLGVLEEEMNSVVYTYGMTCSKSASGSQFPQAKNVVLSHFPTSGLRKNNDYSLTFIKNVFSILMTRSALAPMELGGAWLLSQP